MALKSDDSDIRKTWLTVTLGGNGDYYINVISENAGIRSMDSVRVSTSGGNAPMNYAREENKGLKDEIETLKKQGDDYYHLWNIVDEYVRALPSTKIGESVSETALKLLKEHTLLTSQIEELKKENENFNNDIKTLMIKITQLEADKKEAVNNTIDEVKRLFDSVFRIEPKKENLISILEAMKIAHHKITLLKK